MKYWQRLSNFFESGDLVPFAVIVSIFHYGPVLASAGDNVVVAWIVGAMVDLIHFRSVRRFFDAPSWVAGIIGIATSSMALMYHMRFYGNDWLLAAPIPLGIAILAQHAASKRQDSMESLQQQNQSLHRDNQRLQAERDELQKVVTARQAIINRLQANSKRWQAVTEDAQTMALLKLGEIDKAQAAATLGKEVRTIERRLTMNGKG